MKLTEQKVKELVLKQDGIVCEELESYFDYAKYSGLIGKHYLLDDFNTTIVNAKWFDKLDKPNGLVVYQLEYDLELKERKL